jgi:hypothetical protein
MRGAGKRSTHHNAQAKMGENHTNSSLNIINQNKKGKRDTAPMNLKIKRKDISNKSPINHRPKLKS